MSSLEALERICEVKIYQKEASAYDYLGKEIYKEEINIIKQDLEAYEQLKQDHDITLINNGELVVKVADLQKENQELLVNKNFAQDVALKYKKVIEILKDKCDINISISSDKVDYLISTYYDYFEFLTKEEYELLKEVLE